MLWNKQPSGPKETVAEAGLTTPYFCFILSPPTWEQEKTAPVLYCFSEQRSQMFWKILESLFEFEWVTVLYSFFELVILEFLLVL